MKQLTSYVTELYLKNVILVFNVSIFWRKLMNTYRMNQYSRIEAVDYATRYALSPNPYYKYFSLANTGGDCSNFISQCLLAGGATTNYKWWYHHNNSLNTSHDTWSQTWAVAHALYWYIKINQASNLPGIKGFEVTEINSLDLGDLIFLEDNNGHIFHSAIVTYHSANQLLISQHSNEALNIPVKATWSSKKKHFIKISF